MLYHALGDEFFSIIIVALQFSGLAISTLMSSIPLSMDYTIHNETKYVIQHISAIDRANSLSRGVELFYSTSELQKQRKEKKCQSPATGPKSPE